VKQFWLSTPENYQKIRQAFPDGSRRLVLLKFIYSFVSMPFMFAYPIVLVLLWQQNRWGFWHVLTVPAAVLVLCSLLRRVINAPRPYEQPGFDAVLPVRTKGESCPSRHAASVTVLTWTFLYINPNLGSFFIPLAVLVCAVRVIGGIHHLRDIVLGAALALGIAAIGYLLL